MSNEKMTNERELALMEKRADLEFALTPEGQELKKFELAQRQGNMFAQSTLVPTTYQGNPANCIIALDMAKRMNADPLMVMQNLYIVHGRPAWSSSFLIATVNTCGRFLPLQYECNNEKGDSYGWRCFTYAKDDINKENRLEGTWITWKMAKAEGWDSKSGSKWKTMPEQMFRYRAAAFWQRQFAPELSMGFHTREEIQDIQDVEFVEIPTASPKQERKKRLADIGMANSVTSEAEAPAAEPEAVETAEPEVITPQDLFNSNDFIQQ